MAAITDVIQSIYTVAKLIHDQVQLAKANNEQCKTLLARIDIVTQYVEPLKKMKAADVEQYRKGLESLFACLKECAEFVEKHTNTKSWFKQVIKAGTASDKFKELNEELQKSVNLLNLGLTAQQITDHKKDKKDQADDFRHINQKQDEIIALNLEAIKALQNLQMHQDDQHAILANQLKSLQAQLTAVLDEKREKSKPRLSPKLVAPYYEIEFKSKIGEGTFGKVFSGKWHGTEVAIKEIEFEAGEEKATDMLVREAEILSDLHHPNVVQLLAVCLEPARYCLVMALMKNGSLESYLEKNTLSLHMKQQLILDIATALNYLHSRNTLHRDLKSANILVNESGRAMISDFGLSKAENVKSIQKHSEGVAWQAPECFQHPFTYTAKADVYSFGMLMWEIMTGKKPYQQYKGFRRDIDIIAHVKKGSAEDIGNEIPECYADIIRACWNSNPTKRPEMSVVIEKLEEAQKLTLATIPAPSTVEAVKGDGEKEYNEGCEAESKKDMPTALAKYQASFDCGYFKAGTNLSTFSLKGNLVKKNRQHAIELLLDSAKKGHGRAMLNVAILYEESIKNKQDGTPLDEESIKHKNDALYWYDQCIKWHETVAHLGSETDQRMAIKAKQKYANLSAPTEINKDLEDNLASVQFK